MADHEVVIIGAGPAGIATAISLAERGISSTMLEAGSGKKIGESLPPNALPILKVLHLDHLLDDPQHLHCYGNLYNWGSDILQEKQFLFSTTGHGWHLERTCFEAASIEVACEKNVSFINNCKLIKATWDENDCRWKLILNKSGKETIITTPFVVDATGRKAKLARSLGVQRVTYDALIGIAAHFKLSDTAPVPRFTYIQAVEHGWWYAAPLNAGMMVTVYMTDAHLADKNMQQPGGYWEKLKQAPVIRSLFPQQFHPDAAVLQVKSAATGRLKEVYGNNWLAVGDAAFSYDPVSSYGITSALGGGYYAGNAIADHLKGSAEALPAYRYITENAFAGYLPLWKQQYAKENRWPGSAFWQKYHEIEILET